MKKRKLLSLFLALIICLGQLPFSAWAAGRDVYVAAKDNVGLNLREGPGTDYAKVRENPIPMYTKLHITQETTDAGGLPWGYTTYEGVSGWVCLKEASSSDPRQTATPAKKLETLNTDGMSPAYAQAALDQVEKAIYDMEHPTDIVNYSTFHGGYLVDVTQDNIPELFMDISYSGNYETVDIYQWNGTELESIANGYSAFYSGQSERSALRERGGQFYIDSLSSYEISPGSFGLSRTIQSFSGETLLEVNYDELSSAQQQEVLSWNSEPGYGLAGSGRYIDDHMPVAWESQLTQALERPEVLRDALKRQAEAGIPSINPEDPLSQIAYQGDPANCKMSAEQALAYADIIRRGLDGKLPSSIWDSLFLSDYPFDDLCQVDKWGIQPLAPNAGAIENARLYAPPSTGVPYLIIPIHGKTYSYDTGKVYYDFPLGYLVFGWRDGAVTYIAAEVSNAMSGPGLSWQRGALWSEARITWESYQCIEGPEAGADYWIFVGDGYQVTEGNDYIDYAGNRYGSDGNSDNIPTWTEAQIDAFFHDGRESVNETDEGATPLATMAAALEAYASAAPTSPYPSLEEWTSEGENYDAILAAALEKLPGEVVGVYRLADSVYLVVILMGGEQKATLVRGVRQSGQPLWRSDEPFPQLPTEDEALALGAQDAARPNLSLDAAKLPSLTGSAALLDYVKDRLDNMEGLTPNDPAKAELGAFLESAISNGAVATLTGEDHRVTVDAETVRSLAQTALETRKEAQELLEERDIDLNRPLVLILRLFWQDADWSQPCQVELTEALLEALQDCSAQLLLGDDAHYIQFTAQQLGALLKAHGPLSVQFSQSQEGGYDLRFLDGEGQVIEQLAGALTVGLPAGSMTSTVMASYAGGSDNWGGQYDGSTGTLSFETRFSGRYEVLENDLAVSDIDSLSEESRQAIRFLVSKGFLTLDGELFRPGEPLTRYEFTQALVGMFFALDRSLVTDFPDVPADSPYYPYVASAQKDGIVNGYSDGTFSGEKPITREQVLSLAARTLMERKGYTVPADPGSYLSGFSDRQDVSAWAESQVALAVREGVASRGSALLPLRDITREQAAVILYRLFLLLYEVRPVALELPQTAPADQAAPGVQLPGGLSPAVVGIAVTVAAAAVLGGAGVVLLWKERAPGKRKDSSPSGKKDQDP